MKLSLAINLALVAEFDKGVKSFLHFSEVILSYQSFIFNKTQYILTNKFFLIRELDQYINYKKDCKTLLVNYFCRKVQL